MPSHIADKGQVMVRYYGLCANAHRGKARKAERMRNPVGIDEEELPPVLSLGCAEMIHKAYEGSGLSPFGRIQGWST